MQSIKATLDGGLVREVQKLNSSLVFLTIASPAALTWGCSARSSAS
ncbi:MAG: hypothetical protein WDN28_21860 [Chthoniobacter sp.]